MVRTSILGSVVSLVLAAAVSADWFQFRGPDGQGVSAAKNIPLKWGLKKGVAWKNCAMN